VLPAMAPESFDLLLTDPPYGVGWTSGWGRMGGIASDDGSLDVVACIRTALKTLRKARHFYVFGGFDASAVTKGSTTELIWDKGMMAGGDLGLPWGPAHERIAFGVWTPFEADRGRGAMSAKLRHGSVIHVPRKNNGIGALEHPTQKPVRLMQVLIEASTRHGELVLDPFIGSGTTLVAAALEQRRAVGIEVEERFCELAAKRVAQGSLLFENYAE
jgi:DNA modification methylase